MTRRLDVRPPSSSSSGPTPSSTVVGPDDFGEGASPGTSAEYSRGDHNHGLPDAAGGSGQGFTALVAKTADYSPVEDDNGAQITFDGEDLTATMDIAPASPWFVVLINLNSSVLSVVPSGLLLNGSDSDLSIAQNQAAFIWSDGTNLFYMVTTAGGGGGGGVASLSGTGVEGSPGDLLQAGGFEVTDDVGEAGFKVETINEIVLASISYAGFGDIQVVGNGTAFIAIGTEIGPAVVSSLSGPPGFSNPLVVTEGVNDTLTYTPIATGIPEVFTVAPGSYDLIDDPLYVALENATGSGATPTLGSIMNIQPLGNVAETGDQFPINGIYFQGYEGGAALGDTFTAGPTDILADLLVASPSTFAWTTDELAFFGGEGGGAMQQFVTGALSTVIDPAVKAVLTSLLAALGPSGYNLVQDGTT